jgi:nitric oxide reductase subunit C
MFNPRMQAESPLHNSMGSTTKRVIFFSLFILFVVYSFFIASSVTNFNRGKEALSENARSGKLLFQKYNCISCHQIYGLGGYMGPDLTNVASAEGKGEGFINGLLKYGTNRMPDFHLNDNEIKDLTAYLSYIDKTGKSPVRDFSINISGTYSTPEDEK